MTTTKTAQPTDDAPLQERFRQVVSELEACRDKLGLSDASYARDHLPYEESAWNKMKHGKYPISERALRKLENCLRNMRELVANRSRRLSDDRPFLPLANQKRVLNAIPELIGRNTQNRLIVFLAATGGGKSAITQEIMRRFNCLYVEASEPWRTSYYACCKAVAEAAGATGPWRAKHDVQGAMLTSLTQGGPYVLIIDEGNYFGPEAINCMKLILNRTATVLIVVGQPVLFDRITSGRRTWVEAQQLIRRAHLVVRNGKIQPSDIHGFLDGFKIDNPPQVYAALAKAANEFGMYDLLWRVVDELRDDGDDVVGLENVLKAIRRGKDNMGMVQE